MTCRESQHVCFSLERGIYPNWLCVFDMGQRECAVNSNTCLARCSPGSCDGASRLENRSENQAHDIRHKQELLHKSRRPHIYNIPESSSRTNLSSTQKNENRGAVQNCSWIGTVVCKVPKISSTVSAKFNLEWKTTHWAIPLLGVQGKTLKHKHTTVAFRLRHASNARGALLSVSWLPSQRRCFCQKGAHFDTDPAEPAGWSSIFLPSRAKLLSLSAQWNKEGPPYLEIILYWSWSKNDKEER